MIRETRYPELGYANCYGPRCWRIVDRSTNRVVGPIYKTKAELLADLDRYAAVFGCEGDRERERSKRMLLLAERIKLAAARELIVNDVARLDDGLELANLVLECNAIREGGAS